jgi:hypothetical protein
MFSDPAAERIDLAVTDFFQALSTRKNRMNTHINLTAPQYY